MAAVVRFLGTSDEVTTCDCCGRANLKSTVALSINEGEAVFYGVVCAARALKMQTREVRAANRKADEQKAAAAEAERRARWDAEHAPWFAFLAEHGKGDDTFRRIQSLGGFRTAQAKFQELQHGRQAAATI